MKITINDNYLLKGPWSDDNFKNGNRRYHNHRWACYTPAQHVSPLRIHVVLVAKRGRKYQAVSDDKHQKQRSHKLPTNTPINARREADHVANILTKSICSIDPWHSNCFKEHRNQNWITGRITIKQLEIVEATLRATGQSHHKVHGKQNGYKNFTISTNLWEFIT